MNTLKRDTIAPEEPSAPTNGDALQNNEEASFVTRLRVEDDACIVTVLGDVDLDSSPFLKVALLEANAEGKDVIVDLSGVNFMDSSGFGVLLSASYPLRAFGASLHLVGVNVAVARMLEITRLKTIFVLHNTEAEALAFIRAPSD